MQRRGSEKGSTLPCHIKRNAELIADDADKILHIAGEVHAFAVTEEEMTLVVVIFDGVALNTVFKFHRVDDVDLGDEHHGVGAGGDVLAQG